jgi:hypothetical protein
MTSFISRVVCGTGEKGYINNKDVHSNRNMTIRMGAEKFRRIPSRTCNNGIISRTPTVVASNNKYMSKYEEMEYLSNERNDS